MVFFVEVRIDAGHDIQRIDFRLTAENHHAAKTAIREAMAQLGFSPRQYDLSYMLDVRQ